jgi:hypothetical protein
MKQFGHAANVFDASELTMLSALLKSLPNQLNETDGSPHSSAYTNGIDVHHQFYDWLVSCVQHKIESATGVSCNIHVAMYLNEFNPFPVHSDYDKGDPCPGYAFLIPIDWQGPASTQTHTVIFNEIYHGRQPKKYLSALPEKSPNASDLADNLCSHIDAELLKKLSLALAVPWNSGDVIYWHRSLLHSSDNFLASGITSKTALVVFTSESADSK